MENKILKISEFSCYIKDECILDNITLDIHKNTVLGIIGPKGSGKSIFLRCLNRTFELSDHSLIEGKILYFDKDIYEQNVYRIRREIAMIRSTPNPFPHMSVFDNVIAGYLLNDTKLDDIQKVKIVENALKKVNLWSYVKNDLHIKSTKLSIGAQQKLCLARAIAMNPKIILLDDVTSELDFHDKSEIEKLISNLKIEFTFIFATEDISQAAKISDYTAFIYNGELIEYDKTSKMFTTPNNSITEQYLIGDM